MSFPSQLLCIVPTGPFQIWPLLSGFGKGFLHSPGVISYDAEKSHHLCSVTDDLEWHWMLNN